MTQLDNRIAVGLVGFGTASQGFHVPLLQSSGRFIITHVLERSTNKSLVLKPQPTIVRTMEHLLVSPVQLVVVATPTAVHFDQVKQALQAKKHVVVDKPMCLTSVQAQELVQLAANQHVVFSVFHNRRWDSDFLTVRSLLDNGELGEIVRYEAHFDRFRPTLKGYWKEKAAPGGGLLYDLGAHLVDQALLLFGSPTEVAADVQIQRQGNENDDFFRLEFKYGANPSLEVVLTAGMLVQEPHVKFVVEGTKGIFEKYGQDVQEAALQAGKKPGDDVNGWGKEPETIWGVLTEKSSGKKRVIESKQGCYHHFYANIADVISQSAQQLLVQPEQAVEQIRILEQAKAQQRVAFQ